MPKYECTNCHKVYGGWAIKYKYEGRCPDCGSEMREISNNHEGEQRIEDQERISNKINKKGKKKKVESQGEVKR